MAWRVATSLDVMLKEVNRRWPKRSKKSDGSIGDAAHAARSSDHNPWIKDGNGVGVVRARDFTADGIDPAWFADHVRTLGALGDKRLQPTGYVIYNRQIAGAGSTSSRWKWRPYTGQNAHRHHVHVSATQTPGPGGFDSTQAWGIDGSHALRPTEASVFDLGARGEGVTFLQKAMNWLVAYRTPESGTGSAKLINVSGVYNKETKNAVREFQRFNNRFLVAVGEIPDIEEDGVAGPITHKLIADWTAQVFPGGKA